MKTHDLPLLVFPGQETSGKALADLTGMKLISWEVHTFPDSESLIRIGSGIDSPHVVVYCSLNQPDTKMPVLWFLARHLSTLGVKRITLIAPYLAYMRQDQAFKPGEAVSSVHFAGFLSTLFDELITIDPHLHRITDLSTINSIPVRVLHSRSRIAEWIKTNLSDGVLIGPDSESEQWAAAVAEEAGLPYLVLSKNRLGDMEVTVSDVDMHRFKHLTPVIVDDIISSGGTLIATAQSILKAGLKPPVCIGVHALFSEQAASRIREAGITKVITTNTILHPSNGIDILPVIAECLAGME